MTTIQGTRAPSSGRTLLTPRALLVRGLLAGLVAGLLAFAVGFAVGEPPIDDAIALEESASAGAPADEPAADHDHAEGTATHDHSPSSDADEGHSHGETGPSRTTQKTAGLLTATVVVGTALGGLVALVAAAVMGRLGRPGRRIRPTEAVVLASALGFVAVALVPWMKYPAAPPAVGSGDTIGERTGLYFAFLLVSVLAAVGATYLGQRLWSSVSPFAGAVGGGLAYVAVVAVAAAVMAPVNELGDFPADVLWEFRLSSLLTLATMWAGIAVVLGGLVGRLAATDDADRARRDLAASL